MRKLSGRGWHAHAMIANIKRNELISGLRKAAMLMVLLGEEASGQLLRELSEDEVQIRLAGSGPHLHHLERGRRGGARRVLPDVHGAGVRLAGRHRLRAQTALERLRAGDRTQAGGPAGENHGQRHGRLRRAAESRSPATGQIYPQRAPPDHRLHPLAPQPVASRRAADLAARPDSRGRGACGWRIWIKSRPRSSTRSRP